MKTGLIVIFNHPFLEQLPLLRELYGERFEPILFLHPLDPSAAAPDVHIVYGGGYTFDQMISQARDRILATFADCDAVLFAHNDLLLSPRLNGDTFMNDFGLTRLGAVVPGLGWLSECLENWHPGFRALLNWNVHNSIFGNGGEQSKSFLPSSEVACAKARQFGLNARTTVVPVSPDMLTKLPIIYQSAHETVFGKTDPQPFEMGYPLCQGYSDFFAVGRDILESWFHTLGILASMSLFAEVSIPTSLMLAADDLVNLHTLGIGGQVLWGAAERGTVDDLEWVRQQFDAGVLYIHPVKYNQRPASYIDELRAMFRQTAHSFV